MAKNKTIIKKPKGSGSGNISITIENNLRNNVKTTNVPYSKPVKKKRRKKRANDLTNEEIEEILRGGEGGGGAGGGGGGGGPGMPPLRDVSYIKPPSNNFTVWRDTLDSFNTTIPMNQAQQMGLIGAPMGSQPAAAPAAPNNIYIGNSDPRMGNSRGFSMYNMDDNDENDPPFFANESNIDAYDDISDAASVSEKCKTKYQK